MEELAPEIRKARELSAGLILSVFNLHDRIEQELPVDKEQPPKVIDIELFR